MRAGHQIHPTEEDLILHFYGEDHEPALIEQHLRTCGACATEYEGIAGTLKLIEAPPTPERSELYGLEVWQRIRPLLPPRQPWWRGSGFHWSLLTLGAAVATLTIVAFLTGRYWPQADTPSAPAPRAATLATGADDRARMVALVDHLERSERVLLDFAHADGPDVDVTTEQAWAADLVEANRLYREAATQAGEATIALVLDDLERTLLDLVHAPSRLTSAELNDVRTRVDAAALLFKVRVLSSELREREIVPGAPRKTT
jgi:hypothetical protein